ELIRGHDRDRTSSAGPAALEFFPTSHLPLAMSVERATFGTTSKGSRTPLDSAGHCNSSPSFSDGDSHSMARRGRRLSLAAISSRSAWLMAARLVRFGKYWRSSPLVFSLVPRCQGERGSQK